MGKRREANVSFFFPPPSFTFFFERAGGKLSAKGKERKGKERRKKTNPLPRPSQKREGGSVCRNRYIWYFVQKNKTNPNWPTGISSHGSRAQAVFE
jgi:hypothetical protein